MRGTFDVSGRKVLISGGTSGIGLAMAEAFLDAGAAVTLMSRRADVGQAVVADLAGRGAVSFVAGDTGLRPDCRLAVARAVADMGGLDTVVAAAGVNKRCRPEELTDEDWDWVVDASLKGTFLLCQEAYPQLKSSGDGRIVTIGSMMSILANGVTAAYASAKGGVVQLTRSFAVAWAADGIRANCILPGWIDTPLTQGARRDMPGLDTMVTARTPVGRWGVPADVAGTALFLASPAAAFVTGVALPVDGGYSIRG
ncbi:MAG: SDR family oxidoreductase [Geminicoccaceae bacterium]|nr:MAG: SDR family oxidoreductase [Geminicoccaceae bacterium]